VITNTKLEEKWFNNNKLRWCAPFSACCSSDRHARPSACPVQLLCCISLSYSADRHAHPSACPVQSVCRFLLRRFSDRHTCPSACPVRSVCRSHFVAPLTDMHTPLHAPSDWSAVFHFVAPLIGIHTIYIFLLLTYTFSHFQETLTLPLLCPNGSCACTRHDTNPPYSQKILQWWYYGVNILKMQNRDTKVYVWTSTRQKNSTLCK
jgi:hypothetical protein